MTYPEKAVLSNLQKLIKRRDKLNQQIAEKEHLLKIICTHEERENKEEYIEGSYYDRAEYRTYSICTVCGDKKLIKETQGSYA